MNVHLDHNATSPLHPCVRQELGEWILTGGFGNPSSPHASGRKARSWIEDARDAVAQSVSVDPRTVTFTSGATESNHTAIHHLAKRAQALGRTRILASPIEHPSVLEPLTRLRDQGFEIEWSPLDDYGRASLTWLNEALQTPKSIAFAALMAANNETGAIQPWREWSSACAYCDVPLLVDGTQVWGREVLDLGKELPLGFFTASAHKLGGLAGCGVLVASGVSLDAAWIGGGPQERGRRGGTENVLGIRSAGLLAQAMMEQDWLDDVHRVAELGRRLEECVTQIGDVVMTISEPAARLANTLHVRLPLRSEMAVMRLDLLGFSVSAGSACSSGSLRPSPVLLAMGWTEEHARTALRVSLGWSNDSDHIDRFGVALQSLCRAV